MSDYSKCRLTWKSITFIAARVFENYKGDKGNQSDYMRAVWSRLSHKYVGLISGEAIDSFKKECEAIIVEKSPSQMKKKKEAMKEAMTNAIKEGNLVVVKALVADGCEICGFLLAVKKGHADIVQYLIDNGADVNKGNAWDNTPLHYAAYRGYTEIVKMLLAYGADVNAKNDDGETPLHYAAEKGKTEIVKILLDNGADVTPVNKYAATPMHKAGESDSVEVYKMLAEAGSDLTLKIKNGWTPIDFYFTT